LDLQLQPDFKEFLLLLHAAKIEYLLVGGVAVSYHDCVRSTGDLGVWVAIHRTAAGKLVEALREFGFESAGVTADFFEYIDIYNANSNTADLNKDGIVDNPDLQIMLNNFSQENQIFQNIILYPSIPPDSVAIILHPQGTDPWCHHVLLAALSVTAGGAVAQPAISTACTPQAAALALIEAMAARGMTIGAIIAMLAMMGFSVATISQITGFAIESVKIIIVNASGQTARCITIYTTCQSFCDSALSCTGTANRALCDQYRASYLLNALCAILRLKHATLCIPPFLRPLWDVEGGHGKAISTAGQQPQTVRCNFLRQVVLVVFQITVRDRRFKVVVQPPQSSVMLR